MDKKVLAALGGAFVVGALTLAGGVAIGVGVGGGSSPTPTPTPAVASAPAAATETTPDRQDPAPSLESATSGTPAPSALELTAIDALQRNTFVSVSGTVERIADEDEFILRDATGRIPVWTGGDMFVVQPGELLTVRGYVDDDLVKELYAQEIIRENGEVTVLRGRN